MREELHLGSVFSEGKLPQSREILENLERYISELTRWNRRINLTAIRGREEAAVRLFFDSALASLLIPEGSRVLDIGSGAGFPGMVLAIIRGDSSFVLAEGRGKKVAFLKRVKSICEVDNAGIFAGRLDTRDRAKTGPFDVVITRAAGSPADLLSLGGHFLDGGGKCILMSDRGGGIGVEGMVEGEVREYELPRGYGTRKLHIYTRT